MPPLTAKTYAYSPLFNVGLVLSKGQLVAPTCAQPQELRLCLSSNHMTVYSGRDLALKLSCMKQELELHTLAMIGEPEWRLDTLRLSGPFSTILS